MGMGSKIQVQVVLKIVSKICIETLKAHLKSTKNMPGYTRNLSPRKDSLENRKKQSRNVLKKKKKPDKNSWKNHFLTNAAFVSNNAAHAFVQGYFNHIID